MIDPEELIKQQKIEIDNLKKQLDEGLPHAKQLNDVLSAFTTTATPGIEGINKTINDLKGTQKGLENMVELLSKMTPKDIEKVMKRKA